MSKPVVITADSTIDLSEDLLQRYQIGIIPLTVILGDESFLDGEKITPEDIYTRYRKDGTLPHTAAPGEQEFYEFFEKYVRQGYEVVHIDIGAELSNTYNVATLTAGKLEGVYTVDSRMLSTGGGLLAIEAAECRDQGMSAAEIREHIRSLTDKVSTSFVLDTLTYAWKGGRVSGITALGAGVLQLKPVLHMRDGKLELYRKYRGSIEHVYKKYITDMLAGKKIRPGHIFLTESGEISKEILDELTELIRRLSGCREVHHTVAGCTVSCHCGPKTLGVLFIEE